MSTHTSTLSRGSSCMQSRKPQSRKPSRKRPGRIWIRGAQEHFKRPYHRGILAWAKEHDIKLIVLATPWASGNLSYHLKKSAGTKGPQIHADYCFKGDESSFWASATGVRPEYVRSKDRSRACERILACLQKMHAVISRGGNVLVLCQRGRNRSWAVAFMYYLRYVSKETSYRRALYAFKDWSRVNYDPGLHDHYSRLYTADSDWSRSIAPLFFGPDACLARRRRRRG